MSGLAGLHLPRGYPGGSSGQYRRSDHRLSGEPEKARRADSAADNGRNRESSGVTRLPVVSGRQLVKGLTKVGYLFEAGIYPFFVTLSEAKGLESANTRFFASLRMTFLVERHSA